MLVCSNPGVGVNCGRFVFKLHLVPPNLESEGVYHICCTKLQPGPTAAVEIFPLFTLNRRNVWKIKRVHAPRSQVHPGFKLVNLLSCDSFPDLLVDNWSLGWVAAILPIWSPSSFFALTFLTCVLQVLVAGEFWVGGSSLLPDPETNNVWEAATTRETFSHLQVSRSWAFVFIAAQSFTSCLVGVAMVNFSRRFDVCLSWFGCSLVSPPSIVASFSFFLLACVATFSSFSSSCCFSISLLSFTLFVSPSFFV